MIHRLQLMFLAPNVHLELFVADSESSSQESGRKCGKSHSYTPDTKICTFGLLTEPHFTSTLVDMSLESNAFSYHCPLRSAH